MAYGYPELTCSVDECETFVFNKTKMLCAKHYYRFVRHGSVNRHLPNESAHNWQERFWSYVSKAPVRSDCDNWNGAIDSYGYGVFRVQVPRRMNKKAHRIAWELEFGEIPENMTIDHLCFNKSCVNPAHMEVVTASVNGRRAALRQAGKS